MRNKYVMSVNSGSATLKVAIFDDQLKRVWQAQAEKIGLKGSFIDYVEANKKAKVQIGLVNHRSAWQQIIKLLKSNIKKAIVKVGHRVVHGGSEFYGPTKINKSVINKLKQLSELAPLHNPKNIQTIVAVQKSLPQAQHYACFDTAFYKDFPAEVYLYSIPYNLSKKYNIRKYGFHGLSHHYCLLEVAKKLKKKPSSLNIISLHLGSGASVTAVKNGLAIDTSMGFTPLEGLTMGTRSGDIDPGIIFYLKQKGLKFNKIKKILNYESGIKGLFGSPDLRDVLVVAGYKIPGYQTKIKINAERRKRAKLTLNIFIYDILRYLNSYRCLLGKIDAVVFTGGIGERNKDIRNMILKKANYKGKSFVIKANEELMIAKLITNRLNV